MIIDHIANKTTPEWIDTHDFNSIQPVPGAFEALGALNRGRFNERIFIAFHATDVIDRKVEAWFNFHDFTERTGIPLYNIRRSDGRAGKIALCREYGATHFVDDRAEIMGYLMDMVRHLYLFRPQRQEVERYTAVLPHVTHVRSWSELLPFLQT